MPAGISQRFCTNLEHDQGEQSQSKDCSPARRNPHARRTEKFWLTRSQVRHLQRLNISVVDLCVKARRISKTYIRATKIMDNENSSNAFEVTIIGAHRNVEKALEYIVSWLRQ